MTEIMQVGQFPYFEEYHIYQHLSKSHPPLVRIVSLQNKVLYITENCLYNPEKKCCSHSVCGFDTWVGNHGKGKLFHGQWLR